MELYHGAPLENLYGIIKSGGFDPSKIGTGWGITYGKAAYFTPCLEVARTYSNGGPVLKAVISSLRTYTLDRVIRPGNRRDKKRLERLKERIRANCLITPDGEEYIVFDESVYRNLPNLELV